MVSPEYLAEKCVEGSTIVAPPVPPSGGLSSTRVFACGIPRDIAQVPGSGYRVAPTLTIRGLNTFKGALTRGSGVKRATLISESCLYRLIAR